MNYDFVEIFSGPFGCLTLALGIIHWGKGRFERQDLLREKDLKECRDQQAKLLEIIMRINNDEK